MMQPNQYPNQRWLLSTILFSTIFLLFGGSSWAQSAGRLTGTLTDSTGSVVSNASVVLTEASTQTKYNTVTNAQGIYAFTEVAPGVYDLAITAASFKQYSQHGISIVVGQTFTVNASLAAGAADQTVTVNADASQLQSESSDIGTSISPQMLEDLPLSFGGSVRNPLQFVELTPGFAGTMTNSPTSPPAGGFKLNGGQQDGALVMLDGANLNFISANMQVNYGVSV